MKGDKNLASLITKNRYWKLRRHFMMDDPTLRKGHTDKEYDPLGSFRKTFEGWLEISDALWKPGKTLCADESNCLPHTLVGQNKSKTGNEGKKLINYDHGFEVRVNKPRFTMALQQRTDTVKSRKLL